MEMMGKFRDLARYYYCKPVGEVVTDAVRDVLEEYLRKKAEEISLEYFQWHDGQTWPFASDAKKKLAPKSSKPPIVTIRRVKVA